MKIKLIHFLSKLFGFKIIIIDRNNDIYGDTETFSYFDLIGYAFKKEPLKRRRKMVRDDLFMSFKKQENE
jgi:hypothetical protein